MLDAELKEQLKAHLSGLGHTVELVVSASAHEQQAELVEMLNDVAECSDELHVRVTDVSADLPQFAVHADGRPTGMRFVGIPGGHEFTSLVVAILNAGGKGKLPDPAHWRRQGAHVHLAELRELPGRGASTAPDRADTRQARAHDDRRRARTRRARAAEGAGRAQRVRG